jgi:ATP-binding cassette, subfamily B, bacterial HlyB/CyaB
LPFISDQKLTGKSMDSGLHSLALAARFHQIPVDPEQLEHQFGNGMGACDVSGIIRAARKIGFRARQIAIDAARIPRRNLPLLSTDASGSYFLLARIEQQESGDRRYLTQSPFEQRPRTLSHAEFESIWQGAGIFLTPRKRGALSGKFNISWFLPSLVRYRRLFVEVIVASFFLQLFALATPLFFQVVMDKVLVHKGFITLNVLAFGFVVIAVFDTVVGMLRNYLFSHTTSRVDVELGARLFQHLAHLPLAYFEARQVGQTVARVRELETLRNFITGTALTLVIDLSFTCVFFAVLWYYSPGLTWIVLGSLPFYICLSLAITPALRQRLEEKFRRGAKNQAMLTETVSGIHTVKSQALEPQLQRHWEEQLASFVSATFRANNLNNIASQLAALINKITTLLIIWFGAHLVIAGALSVGQLVAFNMIAGRVSAPILKLVQLWQDFQQAGISLQRIGDILNTPREPAYNPNKGIPSSIRGHISLQQVRFRYSEHSPLVLNDVSLELKAGSSIGLVGRSGSGKSTITRLIQRLHLPESGRVLIDGNDLSTIDTSWLRRNIGVVQQESFLFNRTIRENIAIARPACSLEHVMHCAKIAGAHEFIGNLPNGYDTQVAEQGVTLSGGQRQRIAIARALICDPKILIFDEASSALDYESERVIQTNMAEISANRSVLIIAHRLSAVRHCQNIVVLDEGRVLEQGAHQSLVARDGHYAQLLRHQNDNQFRMDTADTALPPGDHS